jgi:hypothetical protein
MQIHFTKDTIPAKFPMFTSQTHDLVYVTPHANSESDNVLKYF